MELTSIRSVKADQTSASATPRRWWWSALRSCCWRSTSGCRCWCSILRRGWMPRWAV